MAFRDVYLSSVVKECDRCGFLVMWMTAKVKNITECPLCALRKELKGDS